jgi:ribosomal protein S11
MKTYIGIWIDHRQATIVTLKNGQKSIDVIKSNVKGHFRMKGGARSSTPYGPQDIASEKSVDAKYKKHLHQYFQKIAELVKRGDKIMIFGPGEAKNELKREMLRIKTFSKKIVSVEPEDKMTERQIIAKVKNFFTF